MKKRQTSAYKQFIKQEIETGLIHAICSGMLGIDRNNPDFTSEDVIRIHKKAIDRYVGIVAKIEREGEGEN